MRYCKERHTESRGGEPVAPKGLKVVDVAGLIGHTPPPDNTSYSRVIQRANRAPRECTKPCKQRLH